MGSIGKTCQPFTQIQQFLASDRICFLSPSLSPAPLLPCFHKCAICCCFFIEVNLQLIFPGHPELVIKCKWPALCPLETIPAALSRPQVCSALCAMIFFFSCLLRCNSHTIHLTYTIQWFLVPIGTTITVASSRTFYHHKEKPHIL